LKRALLKIKERIGESINVLGQKHYMLASSSDAQFVKKEMKLAA
jgi:hypothetical protein